MKTKVIIVSILAFATFLLVGAWKVFLGPFPSFNYQSLEVPGGIKFSNSGLFISGHEMGYDLIYGYLYDDDRNILFHMDSFLMAGNYVEHQTENINIEYKFIDTDDIIVKDVKSDTSNFGIIYRYVITAKNISKESQESLKDITLYVTFESLKDFGLFSAPDYVNFVSSLNDTSEIENHLSLFETASASEQLWWANKRFKRTRTRFGSLIINSRLAAQTRGRQLTQNKSLNHKKLFLEAFSKYYDLVYEDRLDISDYLNNVTSRWEGYSWENPYVLSVIHEAIRIDLSLINLINAIDRSTITIQTWNEILKEYNDDESFELYCQFVESEVILAADAPYKVKSRFTYLTAYIIHHCLNCIDSNRKEIFKENIYLKDLKSLLNNEHLPKISTNTERLYNSIDLLFHDEFQSDSHNLRNREHHRDGSSFLTESIVKVNEKLDDNRKKSYRLTIQKPVTLDVLINALQKELKLCRQAYTEFEEFVTNAFENFDKYKVS